MRSLRLEQTSPVFHSFETALLTKATMGPLGELEKRVHFWGDSCSAGAHSQFPSTELESLQPVWQPTCGLSPFLLGLEFYSCYSGSFCLRKILFPCYTNIILLFTNSL